MAQNGSPENNETHIESVVQKIISDLEEPDEKVDKVDLMERLWDIIQKKLEARPDILQTCAKELTQILLPQLSSQNSPILYNTLRVLGQLMADSEGYFKHLGLFKAKLSQRTLSSLSSVLTKSMDKNAISLCAWCISQQNLPLRELITDQWREDTPIKNLVESLIWAATEHPGGACKSTPVQLQILSALQRLWNQIPDVLVDCSVLWIPQLYTLEVDITHAKSICRVKEHQHLRVDAAQVCALCRDEVQERAARLLDAVLPELVKARTTERPSSSFLVARVAEKVTMQNDRILESLLAMAAHASRSVAVSRAWAHLVTLLEHRVRLSPHSLTRGQRAAGRELRLEARFQPPFLTPGQRAAGRELRLEARFQPPCFDTWAESGGQRAPSRGAVSAPLFDSWAESSGQRAPSQGAFVASRRRSFGISLELARQATGMGCAGSELVSNKWDRDMKVRRWTPEAEAPARCADVARLRWGRESTGMVR
ncbi:hypothetical protein CYMTET_12010 [Cymbomonas tetramitiformis]|uniref:Telomere-associated protein Rif1 N-terminal domain-containing protein n=1 Tax=Cymbomonas tetramitiformis TaxID=36881 RepID=A0AAE0GLG5_9CHLO|nr:hypothetical protein CYMTET_12010 [Cymbomonas tetramitiformis]